jgi:hypothetical protein
MSDTPVVGKIFSFLDTREKSSFFVFNWGA